MDIKPANILVLGDETSSKYNRSFKLADLGLSLSNKVIDGRVDAIASDAHSTRVYGQSPLINASKR